MTTPTVQPLTGGWTALTISPASLASSSTFVAGRSSVVVDNGTTKYGDVKLAGKITVGTTPTAGTQIRIYAWEVLDDTPTYPDVIDGTDSAKTITSVGVGDGFLRLAAQLNVDAATSNIAYPFSIGSLASLFGGRMPTRWGLWMAHNTVAALHATAGNHVVKYNGLNDQIPSI